MLGHQLEAVAEACAHGDKPSREPSRRAGALKVAHRHAVLALVEHSEAFEAAGEQLDLLGRGALLRPEDRGGVGESRGHVAGRLDLDAPIAPQRRHRLQRPEAAVGGRRAAEPDDYPAGAGPGGGCDQLAGACAAGAQRVVALCSAGQGQPRCPGHFDHGPVASHLPVGCHGVAQRPGHRGGAVGASEGLQGALSPVG